MPQRSSRRAAAWLARWEACHGATMTDPRLADLARRAPDTRLL